MAVGEQLSQGPRAGRFPTCLGGGNQAGLHDREIGERASRVRPQPPGVRICTLTGHTSRSAWLLVKPMARSLVNRRIMSWWSWKRRASRSPSLPAWLRCLVPPAPPRRELALGQGDHHRDQPPPVPRTRLTSETIPATRKDTQG